MRIIAGKFRGRNLKSPPSLETRPTSDRLRETLFNIIASRVAGARFLDLCAGSGAVGIEAISRGADHVTFVDSSRKMNQLIKANLELCKVEPAQADLSLMNAFDFLRRQVRQTGKGWELIFFDPPYADDYVVVLELLGGKTHRLLNNTGLLIVEHHHKNALPEVVGALKKSRIVKQGESALSFYNGANLFLAA